MMAGFYYLKQIMQFHSKLFGRSSQPIPVTCQTSHPAKSHQRQVTYFRDIFTGSEQPRPTWGLHCKVMLEWAHSWSLQQCANRSPQLPGSFPSWGTGIPQQCLCLRSLCGGCGMWLGCVRATLQLLECSLSLPALLFCWGLLCFPYLGNMSNKVVLFQMHEGHQDSRVTASPLLLSKCMISCLEV